MAVSSKIAPAPKHLQLWLDSMKDCLSLNTKRHIRSCIHPGELPQQCIRTVLHKNNNNTRTSPSHVHSCMQCGLRGLLQTPDKAPKLSETKIAFTKACIASPEELWSASRDVEWPVSCFFFRFRIKQSVTKQFLNHICKTPYQCIHPPSAIILAWLQPYSPQKWLHLDVDRHCCCIDNNDNYTNESNVRACKVQTEILQEIWAHVWFERGVFASMQTDTFFNLEKRSK